MASLSVTGIPEPAAKGPSVFTRRDLSDGDAMALLNKYYSDDHRDLAKHVFERQWFINVAFLLGYQNLRWSGTLQSLEVQPLPLAKRRYVANRILPMVNRQSSKLTASPITWKVDPMTPDIADVRGSQVAESVLFGKQRAWGIPKSRVEAALWACINGTGFYKVAWNPWAKGTRRTYFDPIHRTEIPPDKLDPQSKELLEKHGWFKDSADGDIEVSAPSPFEIFIPHLIAGNDLDSCPWLVHTKQYPITEAYNRFGDSKNIDLIRPERDLGLHVYFQRRIKTLVAMFGYFTSIEDKREDEVVTIRELWIPPSRLWPNGRRVVATRDQILVNEPHPYKDMGIRFPFIKQDYFTIPSRFWAKGVVEELLQPQIEYNRSRTIYHQIRDLTGSPKMLSPKGSMIGPVTDQPGQIIQYNPQFPPPSFLQIQTDHALHQGISQGLVDDFATLGMQQEATQAQAPPGVKSGIALARLQEQDDRAIAQAVKGLENAMESLGSMCLQFAEKYYTARQVIALHGMDRFQDVLYFKGSDIRGNTRVVIREGSLMPRSPSVDVARVGEAVQMGALNPMNPVHQRLILGTMRTQNAEPLFAHLEADERRSEIENEKFTRWPPPKEGYPQVRDFDDHSVHKDIHDRFRKSDRYELLPPILKQAIDAHVSIHEQFLQQAMMAQMQMSAMQRGKPGQKGQPSEARQTQETPGQMAPEEAA